MYLPTCRYIYLASEWYIVRNNFDHCTKYKIANYCSLKSSKFCIWFEKIQFGHRNTIVPYVLHVPTILLIVTTEFHWKGRCACRDAHVWWSSLSLHCSGQQPVMCACARICYHAQASARFSKLFADNNYCLRNEISPRRLYKQFFFTIYLEIEFIFN